MTARLTTFWPVSRVVPLGSRSHQSPAGHRAVARAPIVEWIGMYYALNVGIIK
jgi:hypothetical protein